MLLRSESNVETEVDVCRRVTYRYILGRHAEELMVAADKEIEALGVEVDHPAKR